MASLPVLYSFRRCPYAIRARMAVLQAGVRCELREVVLKEKPQAMLDVSSKGTVPVLVTDDGKVIEQSLEVMRWALQQHDPEDWLLDDDHHSASLLEQNDDEFKYYLDRYKYHVGYPEHPPAWYRERASRFLDRLESVLEKHAGQALQNAQRPGFVDAAIFPFIRQFANVDMDWFMESPYPLLKAWYRRLEQSELFQQCMHKYAQWQPQQSPVYFPA